MRGDQLALGRGDSRERERERRDAGGDLALRSRDRDRAEYRRRDGRLPRSPPPRRGRLVLRPRRAGRGLRRQRRRRDGAADARRRGGRFCARLRAHRRVRAGRVGLGGNSLVGCRACHRRRFGRARAAGRGRRSLVPDAVRHRFAQPRPAPLRPLGAARCRRGRLPARARPLWQWDLDLEHRRARTDARGLRLPAAAGRRCLRTGGPRRTAAAASQRPAGRPNAAAGLSGASAPCGRPRPRRRARGRGGRLAREPLLRRDARRLAQPHNSREGLHGDRQRRERTRPERAAPTGFVPLPGDAGAVLKPDSPARRRQLGRRDAREPDQPRPNAALATRLGPQPSQVPRRARPLALTAAAGDRHERPRRSPGTEPQRRPRPDPHSRGRARLPVHGARDPARDHLVSGAERVPAPERRLRPARRARHLRLGEKDRRHWPGGRSPRSTRPTRRQRSRRSCTTPRSFSRPAHSATCA